MPLSLGIWNRLSPAAQKSITRRLHPARFDSLRRTQPISAKWGKDRGQPVDRYYIEQFLAQNRTDIHGQVLEVGSKSYTERYGSAVEHSDVIDNNPQNPQATLLMDLEKPLNIPSSRFDCLVFTQVFQFVFNLHSCIEELARILNPGGVLLATLPAVSRIDASYGMEKDLWRFTPSACQQLFEGAFGPGQVKVAAYGNVLSCVAFLEGIACEELSRPELDLQDPLYPCLMGVRAVKA